MNKLKYGIVLIIVSSLWAEPKPAPVKAVDGPPAGFVTVNYDSIYAKWGTAMAFNESAKTAIEAVNAKIQVKYGTLEGLAKQAEAATKAKDPESKTAAIRAEYDAVQKEIQVLQESAELKKTLADKRTAMTAQVTAEVKKQAATMPGVLVVLDTSTSAVINTGARDISDSVVEALNAKK